MVAPQEHTVPMTLLVQLVELLQRWQIPADELLMGSGLPAVPADLLARLPLTEMIRLLERARLLTGEPGLGYYLALQERLSTYGYVGLAASNASTVRQAIHLAIQYAPLFSSALSIGLRVEGDQAFLQVDENADLGSARDIILIQLMLGLETMASIVTGRRKHAAAEIAMPEPEYNARFSHLVPRWRFGQPANRIVMAAEALDWPIPEADPMSLSLMRATCDRALGELGFDAWLVDRVRRILVGESGDFRSLREVAGEMQVSPRTLTRRLAAQGVCFSSLVDKMRRDEALILLRSHELTVNGVAERLGYATASTFVRAFRMWMGTTPAAYRREDKRSQRG